MKKFINFILVFNLIFIPVIVSAENNSTITKKCFNQQETIYFPIGDDRGKSVFTKKELTQECNVTLKAQGPCIKWEEKETHYSIDPSEYNTFKSYNHEDSIGSLLAVIGAYDQIGHFWSGWHGYCVIGTKYDFSWAKDPMFWASLVASTVMEGTQKGQFLNGTSLDNSLNAASGAWQNLASKYLPGVSKAFGKCVIAFGIDIGKATYSYFADSNDNEDCDPVDNFCDDKKETTEEDLRTVDETRYNDLIKEHPEFAKYIEVVDNSNGIITLRFKPSNKIEGLEKKSQEEAKKAMEKIKKIRFAISAAIAAGKLATCYATDGAMASAPEKKADTGTRFSLKDGIQMGINSLPADWLGPYGALIKGMLSVALEVINSFKDLDTCHNKDDAKEEGTRHLKTYESLPYNLCIKTEEFCAQKRFLFGGCGLHGYKYCCYDQILTKILVAQIKAELGRDWHHCTGITLRDLNYVSFRQCTPEDMKKGFDGTKVYLKYDTDGNLINKVKWTDSFQHKAKCIDLTEFKNYLEATFSQDIDLKDFDTIFQDMSSFQGDF